MLSLSNSQKREDTHAQRKNTPAAKTPTCLKCKDGHCIIDKTSSPTLGAFMICFETFWIKV